MEYIQHRVADKILKYTQFDGARVTRNGVSNGMTRLACAHEWSREFVDISQGFSRLTHTEFCENFYL